MIYRHGLKDAIRNLARAENSLEETLHHFHPVGSPVRWEYNGTQSGTVVMHGYQGRIKVRNEGTGAEYWITAHHIT